MKYKERYETIEKKLYESEVKLANYDGRMENQRREMHIVEK